MRLTAPFPRTSDRTSAKPAKWYKRRWVFIPVIALLLAGLAIWWQSSRLTPATTTTTVTVSQGDLTITVSGSGTIAAARTIAIPFQQSGTVTTVDVKVGDQVMTNQVLAQLDTSDLQLALEQAQANLKVAQANLAEVKSGSATSQDIASGQASVDSAKAQLEKTRTGSATKADIQSAQAQLTAAQAKLDALKNPSQADLSAAQSKVDQAQRALQSTRDSASQAKTNAQLALDNATNSLTQAQSKYASAQHNWQHVQDEGTDPAQPSVTDANGKKKPNKLNDVQRQSYYDAFVQAQASL